MNLWLRMLGVLIGLLYKPRIGLFDTTRLRMRVWPTDLDTNLHMNNGRYLTLGDLGRLDWFARTGALRIARQQRALPMVGDSLAKFRKDLKPFQTFTLETRLLGWDHKWGFLEHRFIRHGRVLGVVVIRGVFKNTQGSLSPGQLLADLAHHSPSPPLPDWVQQWNNSCEQLSVQLRGEEQPPRHSQPV